MEVKIEIKKEAQNMDIPGLSMSLSQISMQGDIGMAVLKQGLETGEMLGQGMIEMLDAASMERSVRPYLGANIDIMI